MSKVKKNTEDIFKKVHQLRVESEKVQKKVDERKAHIEELREKRDSLDSLSQISAQNENFEEYKKLRDSIRDVEYEIEALTIANKNREADHTPLEVVKSAWKEGEEARQKELAIHEKAIKESIDSIYNEFMEIVKLQNDAIAIRNDCATLSGLQPTPKSFTMERDNIIKALDREFPMRYFYMDSNDIVRNCVVPIEARLLFNKKRIPCERDILEKMYSLFVNHVPIDLPFFK